MNVLCLSGMSPAVITETLFALLRDNPEATVDAVHVLTTIPGAKLAQSNLIGGDGALARLFRRYGRVPPPLVTHILTRDGTPLEDIRTQQDNVAAADYCCALVRSLTERTSPPLHVSLAGGRKTMGFHLGFALSLYARVGDTLSHVLVEADWERLPDFMFPDENNGAPSHVVQIASVPFVRLREGLPHTILEARMGFSDLVAAAQHAVVNSESRASFDGQRLCLSGKPVLLKPVLLGFYLWLLSLRATGAGHSGFVRYTDPAAASLLPFLQTHRRKLGIEERSLEVLRRDGPTREFFEEKKARINQALGQQMGLTRQLFAIALDGKRPQTRMGIVLPPERIDLSF